MRKVKNTRRIVDKVYSHVRDLSRSTSAGFCLSSYMELVIPVVAMLIGLGLLAPADLSLT